MLILITILSILIVRKIVFVTNYTYFSTALFTNHCLIFHLCLHYRLLLRVQIRSLRKRDFFTEIKIGNFDTNRIVPTVAPSVQLLTNLPKQPRPKYFFMQNLLFYSKAPLLGRDSYIFSKRFHTKFTFQTNRCSVVTGGIIL